MRPTFLGFETARKGMMVSQKGLDITGHNMTNMYTPGYTRQRVDQVSIAPNSFRSRYATDRSGFAGQGADINGISQTRDQFLDKRFRDQYGEVGYYEQSSKVLSDIEAVLDETELSGVQGAINDISKALNTFSTNASSVTSANVLAMNFKNLTQVLHQYDTKLNEVSEQQRFDLKNSVDYVNSVFEKIAGLNQTISEDIGITRSNDSEYYGPNELMDERNLLYDELARYGDLDVTTLSDGSTVAKMNGKVVVDGRNFTKINFAEDKARGVVRLSWQDDGKEVMMSKGALKASVEFINGRGANMGPGENLTKGLLYYKDKLNTLAQTLAREMNKIIPDQEDPNQFKELLGARIVDADGNFKTSYGAGVEVTAGNISLSDKWLADAAYVIHKDPKGGSVPLSDEMKKAGFDLKSVGAGFSSSGGVNYTISDIGAADPKDPTKFIHKYKIQASVGGNTYSAEVSAAELDAGNTNGITLQKVGSKDATDSFVLTTPKEADLMKSDLAVEKDPTKLYTFKKIEKGTAEAVKSTDNTYIQKMNDILKKNDSIKFDANNDTFTGGFIGFVQDYVTTYGTDTNFNITRLEATASIVDDLSNRRDAVSGVSEIEETTNMMMYSKSYQASARLMTTLDEALDVLINKTGLVGR